VSVEMARRGLRAPVNVTWEITLNCNLHCQHCLSDSGSADANELTHQECCRLVDRFSELKVFQVNIGGGEPFLREGFVELMEYAHSKGLVTCVSTNGTQVDDLLAARLGRMKQLYLQVSLDGATAEVNDAIRGQGTYRKIMAALGCLSRHEVPYSVNMVLTRLNFHQLDEILLLARNHRADLRVSRFRPSGRGKHSKASLGPDKEQLEALAIWLEKNDLVRTGDSFFCLTSEHRRRKGLDMCGAAKMTCCVSPTGDVFPCAFMQEPPFLAGNIRETDFDTLWQSAPIFQQLRQLNITACQTCVRFESCRGGCPAIAYHTYHDISQPDPECLVNLRTARSQPIDHLFHSSISPQESLLPIQGNHHE
jgi:mycofactocin biosynthetic radical S-adenosylmethionine protein MftC